jgi:hypothetical protein
MSPEDFFEHWRRNYGEAPLVGHVLRARFPRRWLRIHSLPGSKRYAETEAEHREILRRQHRVLDDLIGQGGRCELVFGDYDDEERLPEAVRAALRSLGPAPLGVLSAEESGLEVDVPLRKASISWRHPALDVILLAVADDVLETPLLVSTERRCVVAPYDGGVDLIVESEELRDELKARYASWLSRHPAGL